MKRKIVMLMCVLSMASVGFGAGEIIFDFEGSDPVGVGGGTIVEGYATTGTHSLMVEQGGWGVAFTFNDSADVKNALGTVGKIQLDVTTAGFPAGSEWGDIGFFMMGEGDTTGGGFWGIGSWAGGLVVGTTQTITIQLSAEDMAKVAGANWWWQGGIGVNAPGAIAAEYDPITGELITAAVTPTWYFDNVQIVPEPATLVLLGIGALSLIRRKR